MSARTTGLAGSHKNVIRIEQSAKVPICAPARRAGTGVYLCLSLFLIVVGASARRHEAIHT